MKLNDVTTKYIKAILQGPPGRGKTIAGCSFTKPLYVFDFEQRLSPVKNYYKNVDGIDFDTYNRWKNVTDKLESWQNSCPYASVGFDSLTSMGDTIIAELMKESRKKVGEIPVADIGDYGGEAGAFMRWIYLVKNLPAHVWISAHVMVTESRDIGSKKVVEDRVLVTGGKKVAAKIPGYFDEVLNFNILPNPEIGGRPEYVCYTTPNGLDFGKTAFDLPTIIRWTDNKSFFETLYGDKLKGVTK